MHGPGAPDLIPQQPQQLQQLEDINDWVYTDLANGAYKAGFASSQLAYEAAYKQFFVALDRAEALLAKNKWVDTYLSAMVMSAVVLCRALNSSVLGLGLASLYKMFLVKTLRTFMLYDRSMCHAVHHLAVLVSHAAGIQPHQEMLTTNASRAALNPVYFVLS